MFKKLSAIRRGDTIVEVMFAITVFALVSSGSLAIMNRGVETTQRSLEITQVRKVMNDQAELLRYAQSDNGALWKQLIDADNTETHASPYAHLVNGQCPANTDELGTAKIFVIDQNTMKIQKNDNDVLLKSLDSVAYPQLVYSDGVFEGSDGLWIEAVRNPVDSNYIDFHIRACWSAPGSDIPSTLGTIVRLYAQ